MTFQRITKMGLLPRIVVAIALGIGAGYVLPVWAARVFETFNGLFSQFLNFTIPLIILGFVAPAIADIGSRAGRMLVFTALLAYVATLVAGLFSFAVSDLCFPSLIAPSEGYMATEIDHTAECLPYFTVEMPPLMTVMGALLAAFILGIGASRLKGDTLRRLLGEIRDIINMVIRGIIIPLLPLYIFGIFLNMTVTGQVGTILGTFILVIGVIFAMHIVWLLAEYVIAAFFAKAPISRNPLRLLWTMMPAYFTALGTQSSAATIPVTLERTQRLGVDADVAGFTVPLCATIHMSGSALKLVACAMALMLMEGMDYSFGSFAGFIAMLGITIIAAPGVPGGAVMAALGLFTSILGFSQADNAMIIALYIAMDSFGTACNVTGDGALSVIVDRYFGRRAGSTASVEHV